VLLAKSRNQKPMMYTPAANKRDPVYVLHPNKQASSVSLSCFQKKERKRLQIN
jgi:hypothetical protein